MFESFFNLPLACLTLAVLVLFAKEILTVETRDLFVHVDVVQDFEASG